MSLLPVHQNWLGRNEKRQLTTKISPTQDRALINATANIWVRGLDQSFLMKVFTTYL